MIGRSKPGLRPLLIAVLAALAAMLALPWTAIGAVQDRVPSMLSPRGITDSTTPTFVWSASTDNDDPLLGYRLVIDNGPPIVLGPTTTSYTPDAPLSTGGHSWYVTAVEKDDEYTQVDPALFPQTFVIDDSPATFPAPTLMGPSGLINDDSPTFNWSGSLSPSLFHWQLIRTGENEQIIDSVLQGMGTSDLSQAFLDLDDGAYAFIVRQRQFPFGFGSQALNVFTIDTAPPGPLTITTRPAAIGTETGVTFAWTGGEPGATFIWQLLGTGGAVAQGPGTVAAPTVTLQVTPGSYVFLVAQVDAAGNAGPASGPEPFTVQAPQTTPTQPTVPTPPTTPTEPTNPDVPDAGDEDDPPATRNAGALTPRAGAEFPSLRPTLRWPTRRGAQLYNVQVFQVDGEELTKVVSAFPRSNIFRVPQGRLKAGFRYIWRIWPFVGGSYPNQPLGVSYFDVKAAAPSGGGGNARLRRQMLINQRISQAAVRRLNAVQEWLDQGLVTGDLIGGGIGRADLSPSIITGPLAPPHAVEVAAPRPIAPAAPGERTDASELRVSVTQLRINQRIAAAAVRRANALEARLERGLTGGDLRGAVLTLGKLEPGLQVLSTLPGVAPPASQTVLAPLGQPSGRVRVTQNQLRINQRISQAAVRRANALVERLEAGLSGADFRDGSIATANLVDDLR